MDSTVSFLVVGGGSIGERHLRCARKAGVTQLGLIEPKDDRRNDLTRKYDLTSCWSSLDAADLSRFSHSIVASPPRFHFDHTRRLAQSRLHVLCEKPIGLSAAEVEDLLDEARKWPELKVMEAFMYRHHPQWKKARQLVDEGKIGTLQSIHSFFSYYNADPGNIRNMAQIGGGGLMDIGCYCISLARFILGREPQRVFGKLEYDPEFKTDRLCSGILDFGSQSATFTCATQLTPYQRVNIFGTEGRVEIEIPFNAPPDRPCRIWHQQADEIEEIVLEICDQYTIQGDLFSLAVLKDTEVPTPLKDSAANMKVLEAVVQSSERETWSRL